MRYEIYFNSILTVLSAINLCLSHKISPYVPYELTWMITLIGFSFFALMIVGTIRILTIVHVCNNQDANVGEGEQW